MASSRSEMWRAIRLVVDTGIHSLGWTRQQAIDYFLANSSKSEHEATVEVDRYIVWPGQALAYKIGQLKIRELRDYAVLMNSADKFDVRASSTTQVLDANGALPLDVLEARIKDCGEASKIGRNTVRLVFNFGHGCLFPPHPGPLPWGEGETRPASGRGNG